VAAVSSQIEPDARPAGGTLASLRISGYRWFLIGSAGVFGATNALILVRGFLVFEITGSHAALGAVGLASLVPGVFATLYGGYVADRWPKRRVISIGQFFMGCFALWIALLIANDRLALWHLLVAAAAQGGIFGVIAPSWWVIISEIVGPSLLMNAMALNVGLQNTMRLTMPALAGFALAFSGPDVAYFGIAASFFLSVVALSRVRPAFSPTAVPRETPSVGDPLTEAVPQASTDPPAMHRGVLDSMRDALGYVAQRPMLWMLLVANTLLAMLSMPLLHLLPGFVKQVLGGGPEMLGGMVSATSIGALACTVVLASVEVRRRGRLLLLGCAANGLAIAAFAGSDALWLSVAMLVAIGVGQSLRHVLASVLCQSYTDPAYRGRVISLNAMQMSAGQLGTFLLGLLAESVGARAAFLAMGAALMAASAVFYLAFAPLRRLD
jgi:MFS family permease